MSSQDEEKEAAKEIETYLDSQAFAFQRNGWTYYLIDRRNGVAVPIGAEDAGRLLALKAAKEFVDKALAARADVEARMMFSHSMGLTCSRRLMLISSPSGMYTNLVGTLSWRSSHRMPACHS